jgi:hypothetical protein
MFGTLVLYFLYSLITKRNTLNFILLIIFSILAGLSKYNGIILIIGVLVALTVKILIDKNYSIHLRKGFLGWILIFFISTSFFVGRYGGFYNNMKNYNQLVIYNTPIAEMTNIYEETTYDRPGIKSIIGGFFTFRIFDMLKHPIITNDKYKYPIHRTSLWSQLYGRTHFLYFDNWPRGVWSKTNPTMLLIGRISLLLALFPSTIFIIGIYKEIKDWIIAIVKNKYDFIKINGNWIFHIFFWGFIFFIILFNLKGRDFSFMKIIYIFPGILVATNILLRGYDYTYNYIKKNLALYLTSNILLFVLLISYLIPIFHLIFKFTTL